jgi:hypothetical protein
MNTGRTWFKKGQVSPNKGKKASLETIEKLRLSHLGQKSVKYWLGKKQPQEMIDKRTAKIIGQKRTLEQRKRMSESAGIGENNHSWKGDNVGRSALHEWISNHWGRARVCERCGTTTAKIYDWSNNSGKYKRIRSDWERLCRKCHVKKDKLLLPQLFQ